ncbi:MAG: ATP-dependent helicase [Planctomycetota bacterium]
MAGPWLEGLNAAQRQAVTHGDGPLLIVAGAGTGKTKTLACRVAHLIDRGVAPDRILLLTFTRRAADEMLTRAGRLVGQDSGGKVWGGTFHAVANRLLRIHGPAVNLPPDFTVMDESDAADLMNLIRSELGLAKTDRRFPRKTTLVKIYSHTVNAQRPLRDVLDTHFPWCKEDIEGITQIFERYVRRKQEQHVLDYDDLLLFWSALCATPRVGEKVADQFEHILVDEYQDTNAIQAEILRGMRKRHKNLTVVGDDAQSIYSFRAATIRNILDFPEQFAGTTVVTLEQNYRSTQPILAASNAVMAPARERYTKELWSTRESEVKPMLVTCMDESQQTDIVCQNILAHLEQGTPLMQQAVLFRAGHHSAVLEVELARRNIPFHKYGGLKFIEAAHIKDMLAFLRILENPFDEISWFRVLQLFEGVGPRTAQRIMDALHVRRPTQAPSPSQGEGRGEGTPVALLLTAPPTTPPAARKPLQELRDAFAYCRGLALSHEGMSDTPVAPPKGEPPLTLQVERIRKFYDPIFERVYENAAVRARDLDQLAQIATRYRSRSRFITDLTLDPPRATSDLAQPPFLEEDWLTLSTIHSAKGCEWTVVHIIHAADGMIPSDMAVGNEAGVDEERRLFYVAMTRAKDVLYVYFPLRYYHRRLGLGDGHNYAQLTRFLPRPARALFVEQSAYVPAEDELLPARLDDREPYTRVNRLWRD